MVPGLQRATRRVVALGALLALTGVALRGYLPGHDRAPDHPHGSNPVAEVAVLALIGAAIVIFTIALVATLRAPRSPRPTSQQIDRRDGRDGTRLTWRMALILLAVLLTWLIVVALLMQASTVVDFGQRPAGTDPSTPAPTPTAPSRPPPQDSPQQENRPFFWLLLTATIVMMLVWAAGLVLALRRRQRPDATPSRPRDAAEPPPPGPQPLEVAAERGLAAMGDLSREPREAIIACYAAMEDALVDAPGATPRDSDTPSEVLARAVEHHAIHSGTATELVDLFAEARFSPHVMNEEHRETAVRALELVLDDLRSPA
jgi:hypothetical protein